MFESDLGPECHRSLTVSIGETQFNDVLRLEDEFVHLAGDLVQEDAPVRFHVVRLVGEALNDAGHILVELGSDHCQRAADSLIVDLNTPTASNHQPYGYSTVRYGYSTVGYGYSTVGYGYNTVGYGYNTVGYGYSTVTVR